MGKFSYKHVFSFLLAVYLGVELLGLAVILCLTLEGVPDGSSEQLQRIRGLHASTLLAARPFLRVELHASTLLAVCPSLRVELHASTLLAVRPFLGVEC